MTPITRSLPDGVVLLSGSHSPNDEARMCVMEAVAYVAGEPWSDSPKCASPVIATFLRSWNDAMNDKDRQMLVPLIPRLVDTAASPEVEERRSYMALDWLIREFTPTWLRLAGLTEQAHTLESLAAIVDLATAKAAGVPVRSARDAAWAAAGDATRDAAWYAAGYAAWYAAGDAAWYAAGDAAWYAAGDAAWYAAGDAAGDAAWDAARDAAWYAAWERLRPTTKALQVSALKLVERMIEAGGAS